MKHQQILDKLAARYLVKSMDEDLSRLMIRALSFKKHGSIPTVESYVIPRLLKRWNCALEAGKEEVKKYYKETAILAMSILMHKYGISEKSIQEKALNAISVLNDAVVLSDDFFRKSEEIKTFIQSQPKPLSKKPSYPENTTFYRAGDVISIQLEGKYYGAYILEITGINESPVLEFYDCIFDNKPQLMDLKGLRAKGNKLNDGKRYVSCHAVYGMKYLPDLANQVHLLGACKTNDFRPDNDHLNRTEGLYSVSDIFKLQETIHRLYEE